MLEQALVDLIYAGSFLATTIAVWFIIMSVTAVAAFFAVLFGSR